MKKQSNKSSPALRPAATQNQRAVLNGNRPDDWLPEAWTVGTTDVWCPCCGRQILFAPQSLGLLACECNR